MTSKISDAIAEALRLAIKNAPFETWLIIFPASGTVRRMRGWFVALDIGGDTKVAPFIVPPLTSDSAIPAAVTLDPRVLVVEEQSLAAIWNPRDHIHHVHRMAGKWFKANPDVFRDGIPNGFSRVN